MRIYPSDRDEPVDGVLYNGHDPHAAHRAQVRNALARLRAAEQRDALAQCTDTYDRWQVLYPVSAQRRP